MHAGEARACAAVFVFKFALVIGVGDSSSAEKHGAAAGNTLVSAPCNAV